MHMANSSENSHLFISNGFKNSNSAKIRSVSKPINICSKSKSTSCMQEYSILCNNFDPNKCSPPNKWNERLLYRLNTLDNHLSFNKRTSASPIYDSKYLVGAEELCNKSSIWVNSWQDTIVE